MTNRLDVFIDDPRFDGWETVQTFEDVATASAFAQQLNECGIDAALTADSSPDRHGRGDIYLSVPSEQVIVAQEFVDFPED